MWTAFGCIETDWRLFSEVASRETVNVLLISELHICSTAMTAVLIHLYDCYEEEDEAWCKY